MARILILNKNKTMPASTVHVKIPDTPNKFGSGGVRNDCLVLGLFEEDPPLESFRNHLKGNVINDSDRGFT